MSTCIYCRASGAGVRFTSEHVLPDAFGWDQGGFPRNAPTLTDAVCSACNQWFGNTIDNHLARDTIEGLYRFRFGVKPAKQFKPKGKRSQLDAWVRSGQWTGAVVWYRDFSGILTPSFAPQVGFGRKAEGPFDFWFTVENLPSRDREKELFDQGYRYVEFQGIKGADPEDNTEAIKDLAKRMGVEFSGELQRTSEVGLTQGKYLIEERWRTTEETWRAIAKVTFNYLAFRHGAEAALHPRFDPIRRHIRYAEPLHLLCGLAGTPSTARRPGQSYEISVGQHGGSLVIEGSLRLLTGVVYGVPLASDAPIYFLRPLSHRYELDTGEVYELPPG